MARIGWIDAAKALGIFAVYLGHFGAEVGLFHPFVFQYHVPLFFFLAGCTRRLRKRTVKEGVLGATRKLLLPFFLFGLMYLAVYVLVTNSVAELPAQLLILAKGAPRNQFAATSLWFLSCLWVLEVGFSLLEGLRPPLLAVLAAGIQVVVYRLLPVNPTADPKGWYNVDSALAYAVFFILGYVLLPLLDRVIRGEGGAVRWVKHGVGILCMAYAVWMFVTQSEPYVRWYFEVPFFDVIGSVLHPLVLMIAVMYAASFLAGFDFATRAGRSTLYLCGNENALRLMLPVLLQTLGLNLTVQAPLSAMVVIGCLFAFQIRFLIPLQRRLRRGSEERSESPLKRNK